jgi:putative redox protein
MECTIRWTGSDAGMSFVAESGSGHAVVMDGATDAGGRNLGPRPMEMVLAGTGGCTAFDIVLILKRGRHAISGCEVRLTAERADADPKVFTHIHFHYRVKGRQLKPEAVARAIELSKEKYCSASIMIGKTAEITHDFEIIDES